MKITLDMVNIALKTIPPFDYTLYIALHNRNPGLQYQPAPLLYYNIPMPWVPHAYPYIRTPKYNMPTSCH